ncbi:T6SS immunity protein Tdi1 domain-containing protein [Mesorhizobium sp. ORM8.1]
MDPIATFQCDGHTHAVMGPSSYFLSPDVTQADLSGWDEVLPHPYTVLCANCFADVFVADSTGVVHMLEVSAASISPIAVSEDEFRRQCVDDEEGWLLRPLVDRCQAVGMRLSEGQCYAFTALPFLGGLYEIDNVWISSWREWLGYTASIYAQTKDLPEGTGISIRLVD